MPVGTTTVGALIDRFAAAGDDAAGEAVRRAVARALEQAPEAASGVPFSIARALPPAQRSRWLDLIAGMPLPRVSPPAELLAWQFDPDCGHAATGLLTAWSQRFAAEWQPLLAKSPDPEALQRLQQLGPQAFAALPELRRQLAAGSLRWSFDSLAMALLGLGRDAPIAPWVAELESADAGRRAAAAKVLTAPSFTSDARATELPAAAILRLLDDPCPAVVETASSMLCRRLEREATAFDGQLATLAHVPIPLVRVAVAARLAVHGRGDEAEALLRQVAATAPEALDRLDGWDLLARQARDRTAVREMLLAALRGGRRHVMVALARLADDDAETLEALVAGAHESPSFLRIDRLEEPVLARVRVRLLAAFAAPATPARQRGNLFWVLLQSAKDAATLRAMVELGLDDGDPAVRRRALERARLESMSPTAAQWRRQFEDPASCGYAASMLECFPLPADLDASQLPVSAATLATWADGHPERVATVIDRLLAGDPQAAGAVLLLRPDLRAFQERFLPVPPLAMALGNLPANRATRSALLAAAGLTDAAAEWRVADAFACRSPDLYVTQPQGPHALLLPADAALIAAVERRLRDANSHVRSQGLQLLIWLGPEGRALLDALEQALPRFTGSELVLLPDAVCAIAPDAAVRLCEPLLEHATPAVADAALAGPIRLLHLRRDAVVVPGGGDFARKLARRLEAAGAHRTRWFAVLAERSAALPELIEILHEQPTNAAIAAALGDLGQASLAALPELLAAAGCNPAAVATLDRILTPQQRRDLVLPLLGGERGPGVTPLLLDLEIGDAAAAAMLERLVDDPRQPVRHVARRLLLRSASTTPRADALRCLAIADGGAAELPPEHLARLWPQLTVAERSQIVAAFAQRVRSAPWPPALVDHVAALCAPGEGGGQALQALLVGAPLDPRVLARVAAAAEFWNAGARAGLCSVPARHVRVLVDRWPDGDAAFRAQAMPWLQRQAELTAEAIGIRASDFPQSHELLLAAQIGLFLAVGVTRYLDDPDPAVRRAAVVVSMLPEPIGASYRQYLARELEQHLAGTTWEERFGPLAGLPPVCAEIAADAPTVDQPAGKLRQLLEEGRFAVLITLAVKPAVAQQCLPGLGQLLTDRHIDRARSVLAVLRRLGPAARELLPAVERLVPIPALHFEAAHTAQILRGAAPVETQGDQVPVVPHWLQFPRR